LRASQTAEPAGTVSSNAQIRFIPVSYPVSYPKPSYPRLGLRSFRLEPMTKRKLPQLGVTEGRRARSSLRACLEQLRHGGPEAVVAALMGQLRKEERTALLEALRAACPETPDLSSHPAAQQATEAVARGVAQRAALENRRLKSLPSSCSRLICESVRDVQGMSRASARSRLGVALGAKLWRAARVRVQHPAAPKRRGRKSIVDDPGVRERVRCYLEQIAQIAGSCADCAWLLHGVCMDVALVLHGFCVGFAWHLHGFCMEFASVTNAWFLLGFGVDFALVLRGFCGGFRWFCMV